MNRVAVIEEIYKFTQPKKAACDKNINLKNYINIFLFIYEVRVLYDNKITGAHSRR